MAYGPHHFMANRGGNTGNSDRLYFGGAPKSLQRVTAAMKLKDAPWKKSYDQPRQHTGEGNSNPLQYSCLENPRDGGAW